MEKPAQTPNEESIFSDMNLNLKVYEKHIRRARITLFVVGVLQLSALLMYYGAESLEEIIMVSVLVFIAIIFIGLGFWTKYQPFIALSVALILYSGIVILSIITNPDNFYSGIVIKIIILALLVRGMRNAKVAEDLKKTFGR